MKTIGVFAVSASASGFALPVIVHKTIEQSTSLITRFDQPIQCDREKVPTVRPLKKRKSQ